MAAPTRVTPGEKSVEGGHVMHVLVSGPDVHEAIALPEMGTLSVGRDDDADIRVPDPSASRQHASLHVGAIVEIEDLGSANGTHVGSQRIPPGQRVPLAVGQSVIIGGITLVLQQQLVRSTKPRVRSHGYFYDRLIEECARAEADANATLGLLRIHLDATADERRSVDVLAAQMRPGDLLAAYALREYEVLLPDSGLEKCREIAARIKKAIEEVGGGSRLGLACFPLDGASPGALMAQSCAQVRGSGGDGPGGAVVCDPNMRTLYQEAGQAAKSNATVLVLGETGVGKEVLANYIHSESRRTDKPFLKLNCAALAETLLDSELFGHEPGAFTGAHKAHKGLIAAADGGTLFIDEVGEMSLPMQAKLLRAVGQGEITRVGSTTVTKVDVRFIAATNRDLLNDVKTGRFREDLYYRLAVFKLVVPPLCDRKSEIEPLARKFLDDFAKDPPRQPPGISADALALLLRYDWPGNIRELRNVIERALALCAGSTITPEHLPQDKLGGVSMGGASPIGQESSAELVAEHEAIEAALANCAGNQTRAAEQLGISRRTIANKIRQFKIPRPRS
jgi:transcriptional regulator with AAA-type ATPase domain